jgi:isopentenyl-diphosphate delta-isomerase
LLLENRKNEHINLALKSNISALEMDDRFFYEPFLRAHPDTELTDFNFLGKKFSNPLWVSSMTGGSKKAKEINLNLAHACKDFGLGMGVGSCRAILDDNEFFEDFNLRNIIGDDHAFFANLGIVQIEQAIEKNRISKITDIVNRLQADGLIIHVNPLQEWFQPEGDRLKVAPIDTIKRFLSKVNFKVIVKEVGQGFGPESIEQLLGLPLAAIEFSSFGGTNFVMVELLRNKPEILQMYEPLSKVGVDSNTMLDIVNELVKDKKDILCHQLIISGGIKNFLDGYYLISKSILPAVYGQASSMLQYASAGYDELYNYIDNQCKGLKLAKTYLKIKG